LRGRRRRAQRFRELSGGARGPRLVPGLHSVATVLRQPLPFLLITLATASVTRVARAADGAPPPAATLFAERCSTCHNIGGGVKVGPDLLGVIKRRDKGWFRRFVRGPSAAIDGGDAIAAELYKQFQPIRMPDQPLTDGEVDGVWAYFSDCTDKGGCQPVASGPRWGTDATEQEVARGRELFAGQRRLGRGGAPCFACHAVRGDGAEKGHGLGDELGLMGGGTLGPNLTFAYARLGEKGLTPLLADMTSTPVMRAVYAGAPLEDDEQMALKGYLASLARDGTHPRRERDFFVLGLEGMGLVLGAFTLRGRSRKAGDAEKDAS
jgi:mono/diheme cytochrome c family protein